MVISNCFVRAVNRGSVSGPTKLHLGATLGISASSSRALTVSGSTWALSPLTLCVHQQDGSLGIKKAQESS